MKTKKAFKTALAFILCTACIFSVPFDASAVSPKITDTGVRARDPYVLEYNGTYYMFGTNLAWDGYGCVYSDDLKNWSDAVKVYEPEEKCDGVDDWWAPECHFYRGDFYLFATYRSEATGKRGVGIFRSSDPLGPFEIITDGHVTPKDRDSLDGTLYVDESGQPWMVYVDEWTSNEDGIGNMMAAKLSDDLTSFVSEPKLLFRATDGSHAYSFVTDGPFLYRMKEGRLLMLWSNFAEEGYCVQTAFSVEGTIDGTWRQQPGVLFTATKKHADGGHGMIFTAPDGTLMLSIHSPNFESEENPITANFVPVVDIGTTLVAKEDCNVFTRIFYRFYYSIIKLANVFDNVC